MITWQIARPPQIEEVLLHELEQLWEEDHQASPFVSPRFLALSYRRSLYAGHRPLLALGRRLDGCLAAAWPLRLAYGKSLEFISGGIGDHFSCLAAPDVVCDELGRGLALALSEPDCANAALVDIPGWGITLEAVRSAVAQAGWRARIFPAAPCPEIAVDPGPDLPGRFAKEINRHRRVRSYATKLQRHEGFVFEVFEDDEDLEGWAQDYCDAHEWRWDETPTPSSFRFREERERFVETLRSWVDDRTLVRFAIRIGDKRVAMVGAVCAKGRLVYHRVVASPAAHEYSAGMVLIRLIGLWMAERGFRVLDFGIGDEGYKLRFSNNDHKLWRAFGCRRLWSVVLVRGAIEERIRASDTLQAAWDEWGNRRLRGEFVDLLRRIRGRLQYVGRVHMTRPSRELVRLAITRLTGVEEEIFYRARAETGTQDASVVELHVFDALETLEEEQGMHPSRRASHFAAVYRGSRPYGIIEDGRVIHVSWLSRFSGSALRDFFDVGGGAVWCIRDVVTARSARGRGIFPRVLRALLRVVPEGDWVTICIPSWNEAARRGILEAGFEPFAQRTTRGGQGSTSTSVSEG